VGYAAYLAVVAAFPRWPRGRRLQVWAWAGAMVALVAVLALRPHSALTLVMRDWAPAVYIFIAYYATGALFVAPSPAFEAWLGRSDARLLGQWRADSLPQAAQVVLEACYTGCFLLIPAGFAVLVAGGARAMADRYWTVVLLAELAAFAPLPWLPARPPWAIEPDRQNGAPMRRFGLMWVRRTSHCANTFPSGHTAGSLAVALAVLPVMPRSGFVLLLIALAISAGCVSGRYHYAIDVVTGVVLAVLVWLLVAAAHG
jgi:membrane-associated phospholipid phosphatase